METITANSTTTPADGIIFPSSPFVGLRPFDSDEALLFFGRREQTVELLQQLHRTHFIAVVGSSGCGKSSLVRAGLIPKLKAGFLVEDLDQWRVAVMKPGDGPIRNLAAALLGAVSDDKDEQEVERLVEKIGQFGAEASLMRLAPALYDSSNLLLLVDQFEEIFRFGVESGKPQQRAEAEDFVSIMLALSEQRKLPIYVVMTMRSDFLGDCDNFYGLPEAMNQSQYLVPRLTRQQRQQAIEGPILLFGASITPRLLDRVLNDVGDKSDQLPVMQHALMRTWERARESGDPQVDLPHYEAAGGIKDALSKDAEAALDGMSEEELKITERMFQALTDTDARGRRIRRPAHLSEVVAITGADRETILKIIERFRGGGRSFLTVTNDGDPLIDISHESLIRQWERMSGLVEAEAESREMYRRVADAARTYHKHGQKRDLLWGGTQLQLALNWKKEREPNRQWAERYDPGFDPAMEFLAKSRSSESRRKRLLWSVISAAFIVLLGLTFYAWQQQRIAKQQERNANHLYYAANMNLAQEAVAKKDSNRLYELLNVFLPSSENKLLPSTREFYWYYLWSEAHHETQTLKGHENSVWSVAFSPDGKTLASGSYDNTVKLWNVASGQNVATLKGHESSVVSVAFSPDGKTLASGSYDQTVKLWDAATRQNVATLKGHENFVRSVAFSPDGKTLASASGGLSGNGGTVKLWDVTSGQNVATLKGLESALWSVAFSPDGKTLASGSYDQTVKLWDISSRQNVATLKGHGNFVISVAFSPDGKTLASGSSDNTVKLWDVSSRQNVATLNGHEWGVSSVAFSPDGKTLASGSSDKTVRLWDVSSRQNVATLKGHESGVRSVAFSPDGKTLASGSSDQTVKLWDVSSRQNVATLKGHESYVRSVAFSPDGKTLASGSLDQTVKLWDVATRQNLATLKGHESNVNAIAFSPDGKTLATASGDIFGNDNTVKLWDVATRQNLATLKGHESNVNAIAFSPDGKTLASASGDLSGNGGTVKLWDVTSGQNLATLKGHESGVESVAFSPDGKTLASGSPDQTVKLWDVATRQNLATLKGHENSVSSVAFSPDGKTLASGSPDQTVKLWDVATRQNLATLKGHESYVSSVAFSPDGKTLASGSDDQTVRLWDVGTRQNVATLKGHEGTVISVAFSPDGKTLASAGGDDEKKDFAIRLWFAATDEEVARQRNR